MPPDTPPLLERPGSIRNIALPTRAVYRPSPADWRDQILYFLLLDRFSDGQEETRPLLDRQHRALARPPLPDGTPWRWDDWAEPGAHSEIRGVAPAEVLVLLNRL